MKNTLCLAAATIALPAALVLSLMPAPSSASADVDEAKERFKKGLMFVDEGDCRKAVAEFEESYKIYPTSAVLYNMALCYDDLHQYALAMKYYEQFLAGSKKIPEKQAATINERIKKLAEFLGTVSIKCNVDGAAVSVDGGEAGTTPLDNFYLETGTHKVVITKEKYEDFSTTIKLISGKTVTIEATLAPAKAKKAEPVVTPAKGAGTEAAETVEPGGKGKKKLSPVVFYSMLGATAALGIGAGVVGGLNLANHNKFMDTNYSETETWQDLKDRGEIYNVVFLSLIGVTGAAAVTTAVLAAFTDFKKGKKKKEKPVEVSFMTGSDGGMVMLTCPIGR
jgi:hypothetical protein